ncbi:MAG TPA: hypothetical protein VFC39_04555 [Acidobacteriaceae bacterium]|nr:hypothetical protein [Acidobacteriaceae bacterium]
MPRSLFSLFSIAVLTATAAIATAQSPDSGYLQSQPAPIQRNYAGPAYPQRANAAPQIAITRPIPGVIVRTGPSSAVQTVSATADVTELRVTAGRANVSVHHPEHNVQLLVDLPGGQTALLKDGLYTFNASTNTVRVLKGEASVFPGTTNAEVKVKEDHQFTFGASPRATEVSFSQARADLLPGPVSHSTYGDGPYYREYPYPYYSYGFYGYPYGGWGYPYGYPFGFGLGFGYFGGFHGGFGGFHHFR